MENTQHLQLIVHVGEGLENVACFVETGSNFAVAQLRLAQYVATADEKLANGKPVTTLIAPEAMRDLTAALTDVMKTLARTKQEGGVLSMVTFSKDLLGALLNCVYDLDMSAHVVVLLHSSAGAITKHTLDPDACLQNDWPFGALDVDLGRHALVALGFPEAEEVHRRRCAAKQLAGKSSLLYTAYQRQ